jgi:hypothetical protein
VSSVSRSRWAARPTRQRTTSTAGGNRSTRSRTTAPRRRSLGAGCPKAGAGNSHWAKNFGPPRNLEVRLHSCRRT